MSKSMKEFGKNSKGHANLPTEVVMHDYPKTEGINADLDDTITGIDESTNRSKGKIKKNISSQH
jgi:hypothetical protein